MSKTRVAKYEHKVGQHKTTGTANTWSNIHELIPVHSHGEELRHIIFGCISDQYFPILAVRHPITHQDFMV